MKPEIDISRGRADRWTATTGIPEITQLFRHNRLRPLVYTE
jgi:hypothetical protein